MYEPWTESIGAFRNRDQTERERTAGRDAMPVFTGKLRTIGKLAVEAAGSELRELRPWPFCDLAFQDGWSAPPALPALLSSPTETD